MLLTLDAANRINERIVLRGMFEARKRVFIDLLRWDLPALDGKYEIDHFDDADARYLILADSEHRHLASARLLTTVRPSLLETLFPDLCEEEIPRGENVREITRFCLSPEVRALERRLCRNKLVTALAMFALENGIDTYIGVAELPWLRQILEFGWDCRLIGTPGKSPTGMLGALRIDITGDVLAKLRRNGVYADPDECLPDCCAA